MSTVEPRGLIGAAASIISCPDAQLDASAEISNHCVDTNREVRKRDLYDQVKGLVRSGMTAVSVLAGFMGGEVTVK